MSEEDFKGKDVSMSDVVGLLGEVKELLQQLCSMAQSLLLVMEEGEWVSDDGEEV